MPLKVLVICPPSAVNLGEAVKSIQGDVVFTMPELNTVDDNPELYFMKICMSVLHYDHVLVLVTEDLFQIKYVDKIIRALVDLKLGIFVPIGNSYNYPPWFPKEILKYPPHPVFPASELWRSFFAKLQY